MTQGGHSPSASVAVLGNGLRVATVPLSHVSRSHVFVMLRGGPVSEDDETWGLSHVVEHMVFRGTASLPDSRAVSLAADRFGGEIGGATYRDRVVFDTRVDPGAEPEALQLLADMMRRPRFEGFGVEKEVLREELLELTDDAGQLVDPDNLALRRLFNGHVLARSIEGDIDMLEGFGEQDIRRYHACSYGPEHTVIVVAGPVSSERVEDAVRRYFGDWPRGEGARIGRPPRRLPVRRSADVVRTDVSQTSVRICFPCEGLLGASRVALSVLSRILDDGPSSRFQANLIDGEGLAYSLWCAIDLFEERGLFEIGAQVQHERVGRVVEAICQELRVAATRLPGEEELLRVRARVGRDLRDLRDDPAGLADTVGRGVLLDFPFAPRSLERDVSAITPRRVWQCARALFGSEHAVLAMVGRPPAREVRRAEAAMALLSFR